MGRPPGSLLTEDPSDIVPCGEAVGLGLLPAVVAAQIERKPEEEGVVDQLQTGVRQGVLQGDGRHVTFKERDPGLW